MPVVALRLAENVDLVTINTDDITILKTLRTNVTGGVCIVIAPSMLRMFWRSYELIVPDLVEAVDGQDLDSYREVRADIHFIVACYFYLLRNV
jgi:hypothetical protein